MTRSPFRYAMAATAALGWLLLAACSQSNQNVPSPQDAAKAQAQQMAQEANREWQSYQQALQTHNDELAAQLGEQIVKQFPATEAAKQVEQSLPEVELQAKAAAEKRRLAALWSYQVGPMEGGTQSTASLYSTRPSGDRAVRLVLRRHTQWGESVFLFGSAHGFACKGNCTIPAQFDGKPHPLRAFLPTTGNEPAVFIRDDKPFIAALEKTKRIVMNVTTRDGDQQELVFEVGGFDPSKWQPVSGKK
jgi:hypothetical protein